MDNDIDLRELAIDRGSGGRPRNQTGRRLFTRYGLPFALIVGFLSLLAWAGRELLLPPSPVTVMPVLATQAEARPEGTPLFNAAGWVEPRPTPVRVAALAPGVVEQLLVVEDQPVAAGEPVAELIKEDAQLARAAASAAVTLREAELEEARAALEAAETKLEQPVHLEAALGEAEAALAMVATQLENLPFELRRAEQAEEAARASYHGKRDAAGVVAQVQIQTAKSEAESAQALVEELRLRATSLAEEKRARTAQRDALKTQLALRADEIRATRETKARVDAAAARLEQARVDLAERELQLSRMTVRSPIPGRVFRLVGHPGTRVGGGMTQMHGHDGSTIVTLYRPEQLQARVDVRFEDIPKISLQQPVQIDNAALSAPLAGHVLFISSEADIQKNTLQVKVAIPDPPELFKPEMLVDVTFLAPPQSSPLSESSDELRIYVLQQLIETDESGSFVWLADQSAGVARKAPIQTGSAGSNGLVEVTRGLSISSRLIVEGRNGLSDGERIIVTGEAGQLGTTP